MFTILFHAPFLSLKHSFLCFEAYLILQFSFFVSFISFFGLIPSFIYNLKVDEKFYENFAKTF